MCRFLTRVAQLSGAGSIIFSMYPAVRALEKEVPAFNRNHQASLSLSIQPHTNNHAHQLLLTLKRLLHSSLPSLRQRYTVANYNFFCRYPGLHIIRSLQLFLWGYVKERVYVPPLPADLDELTNRNTASVKSVTEGTLRHVWDEFSCRIYVFHTAGRGHIEHLQLW